MGIFISAPGQDNRGPMQSTSVSVEYGAVGSNTVRVQDEEVLLQGRPARIRRVFMHGAVYQDDASVAHKPAAGLEGAPASVDGFESALRLSRGLVGMVRDEDVDACMICGAGFNVFNRKHHCRCCGDIICSECSPDRVSILELPHLGPQRVCRMCFWGQDPVSIRSLVAAAPNGGDAAARGLLQVGRRVKPQELRVDDARPQAWASSGIPLASPSSLIPPSPLARLWPTESHDVPNASATLQTSEKSEGSAHNLAPHASPSHVDESSVLLIPRGRPGPAAAASSKRPSRRWSGTMQARILGAVAAPALSTSSESAAPDSSDVVVLSVPTTRDAPGRGSANAKLRNEALDALSEDASSANRGVTGEARVSESDSVVSGATSVVGADDDLTEEDSLTVLLSSQSSNGDQQCADNDDEGDVFPVPVVVGKYHITLETRFARGNNQTSDCKLFVNICTGSNVPNGCWVVNQSSFRELTSRASADNSACARHGSGGAGDMRQFVVDVLCDNIKGALFSELVNQSAHPYEEWHLSLSPAYRARIATWHSANDQATKPEHNNLYDATRTVARRFMADEVKVVIRCFLDFITYERPDLLDMAPAASRVSHESTHENSLALSRFTIEDSCMSFPITQGNYKAQPVISCPLPSLKILQECVFAEDPKLFKLPMRRVGSLPFRRRKDMVGLMPSRQAAETVVVHPLHKSGSKTMTLGIGGMLSRWKQKHFVLDSGFLSYSDADEDGQASIGKQQKNIWLIGATIHVDRCYFSCASEAEFEKMASRTDIHRRRLTLVSQDHTRAIDLKMSDDFEFFSWVFAFMYHISFANGHARAARRVPTSLEVNTNSFTSSDSAQVGSNIPSSPLPVSSAPSYRVNVLRGLGFSTKDLDSHEDVAPTQLVHLENWNKYQSLLLGEERVLFAGQVKRLILSSGFLASVMRSAPTLCDLVLTSQNRILCTDTDGAEILDESVLVLDENQFVTAHLSSEEDRFVVMWLGVGGLPQSKASSLASSPNAAIKDIASDATSGTRRKSLGGLFKRSTPTRRRSTDGADSVGLEQSLERRSIDAKHNQASVGVHDYSPLTVSRIKMQFHDKSGTAGTWVDCINRSVEARRKITKLVNPM